MATLIHGWSPDMRDRTCHPAGNSHGVTWEQQMTHCQGEGWAVGISVEDRCLWLPLRFARERDARAAKEAIAPLVDWTGSTEEIVKDLVAFGLDNIRNAMIEAMAW